MGSPLLQLILFILVIAWLLALTLMYAKSVKHYKKLKVDDKGSLEEVINTVFRGLDELHKMITSLGEAVDKIQVDNVNHVQKLSVKRFNPFGDTGGNQSFSLALLNADNDGVVLSSLHGRSGTRIYAKPVRSGKHIEHEFSEEEQEVINLAIKEK